MSCIQITEHFNCLKVSHSNLPKWTLSHNWLVWHYNLFNDNLYICNPFNLALHISDDNNSGKTALSKGRILKTFLILFYCMLRAHICFILHRLCVQYVYLPMLKRDIKDVMDHWNNHSIRKQNLGDTIHGIQRHCLEIQKKLVCMKNKYFGLVPNQIFQYLCMYCISKRAVHLKNVSGKWLHNEILKVFVKYKCFTGLHM